MERGIAEEDLRCTPRKFYSDRISFARNQCVPRFDLEKFANETVADIFLQQGKKSSWLNYLGFRASCAIALKLPIQRECADISPASQRASPGLS